LALDHSHRFRRTANKKLGSVVRDSAVLVSLGKRPSYRWETARCLHKPSAVSATRRSL